MTTNVKHEFKAPSHTVEAGAAAAMVLPGPLLGTWHNVDKATRDLVEIIIAASGSGISVHVFGACVPTPCDWGTVAGIAYAANVSSSTAVAFSAQYKFGFAHVTVVGHLERNRLMVAAFTEFTDGSGRSNLYTTDEMAK